MGTAARPRRLLFVLGFAAHHRELFQGTLETFALAAKLAATSCASFVFARLTQRVE